MGTEMDDKPVRILTGWAGIFTTLTVLCCVPLYFVYAGAPPVWNVLTRNLIGLFSCAGLLVFFAGFSHLARRAAPAAEFPAQLMAGAAYIFIALSFVATSLETGVVFGAPGSGLDPTIDGPLAHANMLTHGPIKRLLTAIFLIAGGVAAFKARLLPAWTRWLGYLIALANLAFVPSLYFGTDPTKFYAVHSWGNAALTGSLMTYWVLFAGIALLLRKPSAA
jgi:hypothetical protein